MVNAPLDVGPRSGYDYVMWQLRRLAPSERQAWVNQMRYRIELGFGSGWDREATRALDEASTSYEGLSGSDT